MTNEVNEEIIEETHYGDLYLKFADEASASEALEKVGFITLEPIIVRVLVTDLVIENALDQINISDTFTVTYDEKTYQASEGKWFELIDTYRLQPTGLAAIDIIGIIYTTDNTDPENTVTTALDGWHVNTRGPITAELEAYSIVPTNPRRVWA